MNCGIREHEGASLLVSMTEIQGLSRVQRETIREISRVYTKPESRGQGHARWLMCETCAEADNHALVLVLTAKPYDDEPLDLDKLQTWYEGLGFIVAQQEPRIMVRAPKPRNKQ